jgi:hypothetical protein
MPRWVFRAGSSPELVCGSAGGWAMGTVQSLPTSGSGVLLADAMPVFLIPRHRDGR